MIKENLLKYFWEVDFCWHSGKKDDYVILIKTQIGTQVINPHFDGQEIF